MRKTKLIVVEMRYIEMRYIAPPPGTCPEVEPMTPSAFKRFKNKTILVIDDSVTVRVMVGKMLIESGYRVLEAADGDEAIQKMQQEIPDLVILDVLMPGLDGYGVCETLMDLGKPFSDIPIVFLTTVQTNALEIMGRQFGAYIQKPINPQALLDTVKSTLATAMSDQQNTAMAF